MKTPPKEPSSVYQYPRYYAIGYQWNTKVECDFLEAALRRHRPAKAAKPGHAVRLLDIGCGAGRHLLEMASRGHAVAGFDVRPEMVEYVKAEAAKAKVEVQVSVGDLRRPSFDGTYDLAVCLMDTFRFLLTNDEIMDHLKYVGDHVSPGGLYVTDFWIPLKWDMLANEIYQWEQQEGDTTVRVFYLQHPDSVDPVNQTFEDELVFSIDEGGNTREIRGDRTRTRLMMPQEFRALVDASGAFKLVGCYGDFDVDKPLELGPTTWRMVSVLKKR